MQGALGIPPFTRANSKGVKLFFPKVTESQLIGTRISGVLERVREDSALEFEDLNWRGRVLAILFISGGTLK